jgi:hypothetical protein
MSAKSTMKYLGGAGQILLLAYIVATPLHMVDQYTLGILYLSIGLILVSSFDSPRPSRILKKLLGKIGGLAFLFWLLLWLFELSVVPLTAAQLFWTFVAALVIRAAIEIP